MKPPKDMTDKELIGILIEKAVNYGRLAPFSPDYNNSSIADAFKLASECLDRMAKCKKLTSQTKS